MALTCDEISALTDARHAALARAERCSLDAAKQAIELAYGLLWIVGCDRSHKDGQSLYLARKALYERLDRDGQARGITAAREAMEVTPPLPAYNDPNFKYNEATGSYHRTEREKDHSPKEFWTRGQ